MVVSRKLAKCQFWVGYPFKNTVEEMRKSTTVHFSCLASLQNSLKQTDVVH